MNNDQHALDKREKVFYQEVNLSQKVVAIGTVRTMVVCASLCLSSLLLFAQVVKAELNRQVDIAYDYRVFGTGNVSFSFYGTPTRRNVGALQMGVIDANRISPSLSSKGTDNNNFLYAFCVEFGVNIKASGVAAYSVEEPDTFFNGNKVQQEIMGRLFTVAYPTVVNKKGQKDAGLYSAAMQSAIWEIVYDPASIDLNTGRFNVLTAKDRRIKDIAERWLARLAYVENKYEFKLLTNDSYQDLIIARPKVAEFKSIPYVQKESTPKPPVEYMPETAMAMAMADFQFPMRAPKFKNLNMYKPLAGITPSFDSLSRQSTTMPIPPVGEPPTTFIPPTGELPNAPVPPTWQPPRSTTPIPTTPTIIQKSPIDVNAPPILILFGLCVVGMMLRKRLQSRSGN